MSIYSTPPKAKQDVNTDKSAGACAQVTSTPDRAGLSMGHISPRGFADIYSGASLIKVSKPKFKTLCRKGGGIRGKAGFSVKSRRRLMQTLSRVKRSETPIFLTLTYPGQYSSDPKRWKRDLDCFWRRLVRRYPHASAIWKLEFQKRGAPHYHIFVWGVPYAYLRGFVAVNWFEVVGSGDIRHLQAGTRVEYLRSVRGTFYYAGKYISKSEAAIEDVGRWWGVLGAEFMPWGELIKRGLNYSQAVELMRAMRRFAHIKARDYKSLTLMCTADQWLRLIDSL